LAENAEKYRYLVYSYKTQREKPPNTPRTVGMIKGHVRCTLLHFSTSRATLRVCGTFGHPRAEAAVSTDALAASAAVSIGVYPDKLLSSRSPHATLTVAGPAGLHHTSRVRCLTALRHPNLSSRRRRPYPLLLGLPGQTTTYSEPPLGPGPAARRRTGKRHAPHEQLAPSKRKNSTMPASTAPDVKRHDEARRLCTALLVQGHRNGTRFARNRL
jgi:hypothetical protein